MSPSQMIGTRVTMEVVEEISKAIEKGFYLTPSHLVRAAIQNELNRLKVGDNYETE